MDNIVIPPPLDTRDKKKWKIIIKIRSPNSSPTTSMVPLERHNSNRSKTLLAYVLLWSRLLSLSATSFSSVVISVALEVAARWSVGWVDCLSCPYGKKLVCLTRTRTTSTSRRKGILLFYSLLVCVCVCLLCFVIFFSQFFLLDPTYSPISDG